MTVAPQAGWGGREDSSGELTLILPGEDEYGVGFALDLVPVRGERAVKPRLTTASRWISLPAQSKPRSDRRSGDDRRHSCEANRPGRVEACDE
jgi:hypothetical protein